VAWGESTFKLAKEAYDGVVAMKAELQHLLKDSESFQNRLVLHMSEFKRDIEQRLHHHGESQRNELSELSRRLRELESRQSQTEGKVSGALSEAYARLLRSGAPPAGEDNGAQVGSGNVFPLAAKDGASGSGSGAQ
jgi:hypothetical protein